MGILVALTLVSAMAVLANAVAISNDIGIKSEYPPFQRTMTYAEALAKELIQGDPEICVGAATGLPSSTTAYGCCLGTRPGDTCFISSPEVTKILKEWFKRDQGLQYLSSWHGLTNEGLYSMPLKMRARRKRQADDTTADPTTEPTTAAADAATTDAVTVTTASLSTNLSSTDLLSSSIHSMTAEEIKSLMAALATQTTTGLNVCYNEINKEVNALADKAATLATGALDNYIPALAEICPTKMSISYGTVGQACDASGGVAQLKSVSIAQGVHFVNPLVQQECDWDKIRDGWVSKTMCGIKCQQVYRLENFISQELIDGVLQVKWNRVKVAYGCKAFLEHGSAMNRSLV